MFPEYRNLISKLRQEDSRFAKVFEEHNALDHEIIRLEKQNKIFVIRPNVPLNIGRLERDKTKIRTVYELGEKILSAQIQDLKKYLTS